VKIHIVATTCPLSDIIARRFRERATVSVGRQAEEADVHILLPGTLGTRGLPPAPETLTDTLAGMRAEHTILVSSAAVHPPRHHHPGMVGEITPAGIDRSPVARAWWQYEEAVRERMDEPLAILRPASIAVAGGRCLLGAALNARWVMSQPGHDPTVQLLHPEDLAEAIARVVAEKAAGVFNIAPAGNIPSRKAFAAAGTRRLPVPRWVQACLRALTPLRPMSHQRGLRFCFTVSGAKIRRELGFAPTYTSEAAAAAVAGKTPSGAVYDDHGWEKGYTDLLRATNFKFLHDVYWRVEVAGLDRVPRQGKGVLVGVHRGFMPFDGAMAMSQIARETGRYTRFLVHPCLVKPAFQADFIRRIGGVVATRENARRLLADGHLVGIFPEGIRGAFTPYKDAYRLGNMGRDEYVRIALRSGAPLIPFVTVGSAEIYPIIGGLHWRPLTRWTEWPYLPITVTPVPLPSKWHTLYLEPIRLDGYDPEAADDRDLVREIGSEVSRRLTEAMNWMRAERPNIFFGTIFKDGSPSFERVEMGEHG